MDRVDQEQDVVHIMVGDLQRIWEYPKEGYMVEQAMPMAALGRGRGDLTKADRQFGQKGVFFGRKTKISGPQDAYNELVI